MLKQNDKMPKSFVIKFLKTKGYKELYEVTCDCIHDFIRTDHPIKWLYEHVSKGHEPRWDACHSWNRQVGRNTGEFEEWYRWWTSSWNKKIQDWQMIDCFTGLDGYEQKEDGIIKWWNKRTGLVSINGGNNVR